MAATKIKDGILLCSDCGSKVLDTYYPQHELKDCTAKFRPSIASHSDGEIQQQIPPAATKARIGRIQPKSSPSKRRGAKPDCKLPKCKPEIVGKRTTKNRMTKKRIKRSPVDPSLFAPARRNKLSSEQIAARNRIEGWGFHEGALVPGSNLRKVDK